MPERQEMTARELLERNLEDIRLKLEDQSRLLDSLRPSSELPEFLPSPSRSTRDRRLRDALLEAIKVLDESRKAFKSKRLEALRKKLIEVLADTKY
jgi:hypothetical protein